MISFFFKFLFLGMLLAFIAWSVALLQEPPAGAGQGALSGASSFAIADQWVVQDSIDVAARFKTLPGRLLPWLKGGRLVGRLERIFERTGVRFAVARRLLPLALHLLLAGLVVGLACREACRNGLRFASPTQAWLGKHLAGVAVLVGIAFAATPLAMPVWLILAFPVALSLGALTYAANLPVKV